MRSVLTALVLGAAAWAAAPAARADDCDTVIDLLESASQERQARHPQRALQLLRDMAERCPDHPVMLAEMGFTQEGVGLDVAAEENLTRSLAAQGSPRWSDPRIQEWFRRATPEIYRSLRTLEGRLGWLLVTSPTPDATLEVEGGVYALPLNRSVRVPARRVTYALWAAGRRRVERTVTIAARETLFQSLDLASAPAQEAAPEAPPPARRAALREAVTQERTVSPWRVAGWVTMGTGAALGIVGAVQWARSADQRAEGLAARVDSPGDWGAWARYAGDLNTRDSATICASARGGNGNQNDASRVTNLCDTNDDTRASAWAFSLAGLGLLGGGVLMAVLGVDESPATRSVPRLAVFWSGDTRVRLTIPFQ